MVGGVSRTDEHVNRQPKSSGPPLRAFAMVLISLAILFAGLGFASMGGSDESASAAATTDASGTDVTAQEAATSSVVTAPRATTTTAATTTASGSDSLIAGAPESAAPVRIYNNSEIAGLAAQTASLLEDEGFVVSETGNYSDGLLAQTSVFYGTGAYEQVTAEAVAAALGVTAQPRFDGIVDAEPGVIVIVTSG